MDIREEFVRFLDIHHTTAYAGRQSSTACGSAIATNYTALKYALVATQDQW